MWPDRVSNPGPLTYESGALPIALRGPAEKQCNGPFITGTDRAQQTLQTQISLEPSAITDLPLLDASLH